MESEKGTLVFPIWEDQYNKEYLQISNGYITFVCDFLHEYYTLTLTKECIFNMYRAAYYDKTCNSARMIPHFEAFVSELVNYKYENKARQYAIDHFSSAILKDESNPYGPVMEALKQMEYEQLIVTAWFFEDAFTDIILCSRIDFIKLTNTYKRDGTESTRKNVMEKIDFAQLATRISGFSRDVVKANQDSLKSSHGEGIHVSWISNRKMTYTVSRKISEDWGEYDRTVASTHLSNYGVFFLDEYGKPIDDEYDLEKIYDDYAKEK